MNEKCFDGGAIQAFLDGELTPQMSLKFTNHISKCAACAAALAAAEEETAFVFAALDGEMNALVPTQRLWTKINESITEEKRQTPVWRKLWNFIAVSLANPSLTAAGILLVLGIFTAVLTLRNDSENPLTAVNNLPKQSVPAIPAEVLETIDTAPASTIDIEPVAPVQASVRRAASREDEIRSMVVRTDFRKSETHKLPATDPRTPKTENAVYIPGEESYVKTIATLKQTVDVQKDTVLRPAQRVAFERDLAVVEDSIRKMKKEVRKNPKNESAKQILYTAYQNKIDLLNSVAGRNELMASLK